MKTTYALLGGVTGALAMPHLAKRADYACNPAHSYPNGASCISTNGALSLVAPAPSSTGYACNPAHSYPNGASCVSTNGALSLVTPAPASTTGYACNPAHSYPNGARCVSTNGALSLVTPAPSSTGYACNPAHSYPNNARCVSTNGALSLVTPAPSSTAASTTYACNPAHSYPNGVSCTAVNGALTLVTPTAAAKPTGQVAPQLGTWTIENLTRYCSADGSGCDYNFEIKTSDGFGDKCTIIEMNGVGPKSSWANQPCSDGSVYHVSWGYAESSNPAFAVITVDQIQDKTRAFFGVPDVNGQFHGQQDSTFGSGQWQKLGPEPVNPVN